MANTALSSFPVATTVSTANDYAVVLQWTGSAFIDKRVAIGNLLASTSVPALSIGTVTTGTPGSSATASVTGTSPNYVLNLTIPQGATGMAGAGSGNLNSTGGSYVAGAIPVYADTTGNLVQVGTPSSMRTVLGLGTAATQATSAFLQPANNLSDVSSASTARTNLGLGSAATQATATFLQTSNNLSDVTASTARTNLGLGSAATQSSGAFLQLSNNLSDVATPATARTNLGLGGAATLNVGTSPGTVAAGDDARLIGAALAPFNFCSALVF